MVIHLSGLDSFRSHQRFQQLRDAFRAKYDPSGLSTKVIDGDEMSAETLRSAVGTVGFFSSKRFLGIQSYTASSATCAPEEVSAILQPIAKVVDAVVVIRELTPAIKRRAARSDRVRTKNLKIRGASVEIFSELSGPKLRAWITSYVRSRGGAITVPAAARLIEAAGSDLWRLASELEKLMAYAAGAEITPSMVQELVRAPEISNVFDLTDALGHRQTSVALGVLQRELEAGTHPLALVTLLTTHVRNLLFVQAAQQAGRAAPQIASELRLHPFVVQKALEQGRRLEPERLRRWHRRLVEIEVTLKTSRLDPETLLDRLMVLA